MIPSVHAHAFVNCRGEFGAGTEILLSVHAQPCFGQ